MSPFFYQNLSVRKSLVNAIRIIFSFFSPPSRESFAANFLLSFQTYFQIDNCFLFFSNRSALYYLLSSLNLSKGDEVIVTAFTCTSVIHAINLAGLKPVLVDINPLNLGTSLDSISINLSIKTRVVIVQHTFGIPADIISIKQFCQKHDLFLIEDCALALFSRNDHDYVGKFGDASIWSFELSKTISSGWGGLLSLNISSNKLKCNLTKFSNSLQYESTFLTLNRALQSVIVRFLTRQGRIKLFNYVVSLAYRFKLFRKSSEVSPNTNYILHDLLWECTLDQFNKSHSVLQTSYSNASLYLDTLKPSLPSNSFLLEINLLSSNLVRFPLLIRSPIHFIKFFSLFNLQVGEWFRLPLDIHEPLSSSTFPKEHLPFSFFAYNHIVNLPLYCNSKLAVRYQEVLSLYLNLYPDSLIDFPAPIQPNL